MTYRLGESACRNFEVSANREWMLANGRGGYAMGTVAGLNTRRYHGHLIAATNPPTERKLILASVEAELKVGLQTEGFSTNQYPGAIHPTGYKFLTEFEVDDSVRWIFQLLGVKLRKELVLVPGEDTVWIRYSHLGGFAADLILKPLIAYRDHHGNFHCGDGFPSQVEFAPHRTRVTDQESEFFLHHEHGVCTPVQGWYYRFEHIREAERGLDPRDDFYCVLELRHRLSPGDEFVVGVSTLQSPSAPTWPSGESGEKPFYSMRAALSDAVRHFVVQSSRRPTVLAGYPWFTDWGRDTMISLPGLCLVDGQIEQVRAILRSYSQLIRDGLIPNRVVSEDETPDYNTVDATLWFANAVWKCLQTEWDEAFAAEMITKLHQIYWHHVKGTHFGIRVDSADGLLTQGEDGVNLTWMDAKIGDWVVTPRYGKPVEVNALWINLLNVLAELANRVPGHDSSAYLSAAQRAKHSFEEKFWHEGRAHYLDTVDPADASLRPNQVIAMALPFSPCRPERAARALATIKRELLTPVGLRTLGRNEPGYRGKFDGDMGSRDSAYHQGTVWPWLLGSYATAVVKHAGDIEEARRSLRLVPQLLEEYGLGGIAEVYDGDPPHRAGGCPWQAWSAAEILRAWVEDCGGD